MVRLLPCKAWYPPSMPRSLMPKPVSSRPGPQPDPLAGVVDRLLAQLPGLQGQEPSVRSAPRAGVPVTVTGLSARNVVAAQPARLSMWIRVLLGLTLAVTMGSWPYSRDCGLPLLSYFGAVSMVSLAGVWAAIASWKARGALAHVISLTLIFYSVLLAASELLPRTGYAMEHATWTCSDLGAPSSIVLSQISSLPKR
jgi:hypothetical protein